MHQRADGFGILAIKMYFCIESSMQTASLMNTDGKVLKRIRMIKRILLPLMMLVIALTMTGCAHAAFGKLVGSDRDEHGCIGSAGYTWSYALHDCIRLWEAGTRFDAGPEQTYVVFSADSTFAEIFSGENTSVLCRKVKNKEEWKPRKGKEWVKIQNGILCAYVNDFTYTRKMGE